ncbi:MAG: class I tRNA ligase family protein, partial [Candidatus Thiodiazotropha endolucinida]|nr:class I tRNA ligase family protein [Candidatus Thiodiazotropha taylori]MCW4237521.1 class I tRNA ligase family protein [Candidatus Thiodiazotropha endolucinida]
QGMVVADTYYREAEDGSKHWYNPTEVDVSSDDKGRPLSALLKADNSAVQIGGIEKMSKSKNNGVDPQTLIDRYGADTVRLYTMFTSPPDQSLEWSDDGVEGAYRFIKRLWALADGHQQQLSQPLAEVTEFGEELKAARRELHELLKKALYDYQRQRFNNVVSASMGMTNILYKLGGSEQDLAILKEGLSLVLRLLAPIAPHVSHHLWRELGFGEEILASDWLKPDEAALVQESLPYVVQVNGKVRANIQVPADADKAAVEAIALANDNVQRFIGEATVRKVIVVPNKLVNVVAK